MALIRKNRKGGTASLRSRTCVKRNAVFGARVKGLSLYFLYQRGNLIRIKTGLDTCLIRIQTRTPLSRYPPLMIILIDGSSSELTEEAQPPLRFVMTWNPQERKTLAVAPPREVSSSKHNTLNTGEVFLLTVEAFLLTVKLLCLQSLKALIRRTFPL